MSTPADEIDALVAERSLQSTGHRFDDGELASLDEPVARYFRTAIAPGKPLARAVRLRMQGQLKLGPRWLRFRARQLLAPHDGFVWAARVAGVISGSDHYVDSTGGLDWRLLGIVPVMRASGPDVARSSAGRGAAEAVWLPTALLPRFGVRWTATDDHHLTAHYAIDDIDLTLRLALDDAAHIRSVTFDRWGDPDESGTWGWHPFGIDVTATATMAGLTIPAAGEAGWFHGTDRWPEGAFFRFRITDAEPWAGRLSPAGRPGPPGRDR
jgi:hypothetical protein